MTMWLSSVKINSNSIIVRHIQRGYPLKAINKKMKNKEKILKAAFQYTSKSPTVKNIYSEIFFSVIYFCFMMLSCAPYY